MTIYNYVINFKRKYPLTVAWRILSHAKIVKEYLNQDEEVTYAFASQKNGSSLEINQTAVLAVTNKRLLIGQKRVVFGHFLNSITPDLYNDLQIYKGLIWGKITIDTVKETIVFSNISNHALDEIETAISTFMMEAKKEYYNPKRTNNEKVN